MWNFLKCLGQRQQAQAAEAAARIMEELARREFEDERLNRTSRAPDTITVAGVSYVVKPC